MPTLTFKVTAEQDRAVRLAARQKKLSLSDYLRRAAMGEKPSAAPRVRLARAHKVSGLSFSGDTGPLLTDEAIREALADFP